MFADGVTHLDFAAAYRNVFVVHAQVAFHSRVTQSAAADQVVTVARRQIAMIDRVTGSSSASPSASAASASRVPSPTSAALAVRASAQQLVLPLGDLPLSGYKVGQDQGTNDSWLRFFDALGSDPLASDAAHYSQVELVLLVKSDADSTASFMAGVKCDPSVDRAGSSSGAGPTSAKELVAPRVGDGALACSYVFADGLTHVEVAATHRNVFVLVQAARWNTRVPESTAVDESVAILQRQFAIIDRLSPP